jgi:cytochrome d ubiquinol oxidase subunit II
MGAFTLADLIAGITLLALNAYVVLAGADFGAGVWDLVARGPRAERQRETIETGISPIWEANHVWLILVIVLLFGCFPPVYAYISVQLHIPLVLMLIGIVLRGSAFTFRAYDSTGSAVQKHWGRLFAIASTITPVLLGMCVGAIFSGALVIPEGADFVTRFVAPWTSPFAIVMGFLTLAVFAFLAAVYLTVEATADDLRDDFRRLALGSAVAVGLLSGALLLLGSGTPMRVTDGLLTRPLSIVLQLFIGLTATAAIAGLWTRRYRLARAAAVLQVSGIVWGWGYAQYPALIPGVHTIQSAAAPQITLKLVAIGLAAGGCILVPALWYLFRVFKSDGASAFERVDTAEYTVPPK